jgi:diphthine synthase
LRELVFVGLGLNSEKGISLSGLEEAKRADHIFMELYTSIMPSFSLERFEVLLGKRVNVVTRRELEEENGKCILDKAEKGKTVFLVPGDPLIATTHIVLRIEAKRRGIKTRIIHGASIITAIIGLSGLHNYMFGKTVTIPFPDNFSETPYKVIAQNKMVGLHTLCLLDLRLGENRSLSINEALTPLSEIEQRRNEGIVTPNTIGVGIARAGSETPTLKAGYIKELLEYDFGDPPQSLIFPGELHFMEVEALIMLADGPEELRGLTK